MRVQVMSLKGVVKQAGKKYTLVKSTYDISDAWDYIKLVKANNRISEADKEKYKVVTRVKTPEGNKWMDVLTDKILEV